MSSTSRELLHAPTSRALLHAASVPFILLGGTTLLPTNVASAQTVSAAPTSDTQTGSTAPPEAAALPPSFNHGWRWFAKRTSAPLGHSNQPARSAETGRRFLGSFLVTCYDLTGHTATGTPTNGEVVAVDPSIIPLGTRIDVDGAGSRVAEDTGGAIVGDRLDIWEPTYSDCVDWGAQYRQVWIEG